MKKTDWALITNKVKELYPNVLQIASYSNKRWLLAFEEEPDRFLNTFQPLAAIVRKFRLETPLIVNRKFIQTSLDCYPLEFLDIQSDYTNLYAAEDIIATLQFAKEDIRRQIEREIKSKLLLTRLYALQFSHIKVSLYRLMRTSLNSLLPVFKGICYLQGISIPKETEKLLDHLEETVHTDVKVFRYVSTQKKAPSLTLLANIFHDYIRLLTLCGEQIDNWKTA